MDRNFRSALRALPPPALAFALAALTVSAPAAGSRFVGLTDHRLQLLVKHSGVSPAPTSFDRFGAALAVGDFDADGADDLAIGIPFDECGAGLAFSDCGEVQVWLGRAGLGLAGGAHQLRPEAAGEVDPLEAGDRFGTAIAAGDFNGDGLDDLAIGQPGAEANLGAVDIHYGQPDGPMLIALERLIPGIDGAPGAGSNLSSGFGSALAVGNFDCDGFDDVAIGFPRDFDVVNGLLRRGGSVHVAHGSVVGVAPFTGYRISQEEVDIPDVAEAEDGFGEALAVGDWNGDGCDDLAIGVPGEDAVGAVLFVYGSPNGLIFAASYWIGKFDLGLGPTLDDRFGAALTAGDFNADGYDDVVIGIPGQDDNDGDLEIGMAGAIYGAPGWPLGEPAGGFNWSSLQWWWEGLVGTGDNEANDQMGSAFATGDFDGDGYDDLAIGSPYEDDVTIDAVGRVTALAGSAALLTQRSKAFQYGESGALFYLDGIETDVRFGAALAAGDFDADGFDDLAIGLPLQNADFVADSGRVAVLYGSLFRDGFESHDTAAWSTTAP